jgi:hypothetical protein
VFVWHYFDESASNIEEVGMRLPGTRYQEHGWEQVRKLLGQCSLQAFARCDPAGLLEAGAAHEGLALYVDLVGEALHAASRSARAQASGNSYGDSVLELAFTLLYELQARPGDWSAFCAALSAEERKLGPFWRKPGGDALLRKKVNDMYALLRDKVDADNYQAACGRPCSANRMYAYRMLDTAYGEIARLFQSWREHAAQVGAILGRALDAEPIEARQMKSIGLCRAEWVLRWSESLERFTGSAGPLHTRSKRFASLQDSPDKIGAMLREIGDYEELSANRDQDWLQDGGDAGAWLDDYWRVLGESLEAATPGPDQVLEALQDQLDDHSPPSLDMQVQDSPAAVVIAERVSLPPRFVQMAQLAEDRASWSARMMAGDSLPVRLAVYLKLLGPFDDSYPRDWLDPASGELPTMQQLAALDDVSLPTLRKRRDAAIARLLGAQRNDGELR